MYPASSAIGLTVVIPAYNEERRLPAYLERVLRYLDGKGAPYEVIVVDDGSSDATGAAVGGFAGKKGELRLITLPENRGKGYAVRTGMLAARGSLVLFCDADGATPIGELERLQQAIEAGADAAIGSRALRDRCCTVRAHLHRKVLGAVFNCLVGLLAVTGIRDTQCGFKLFTLQAARSVFTLQRIEDFGFDVEVLYLLGKKGYRVAEVPVNWADVKGSKVGLVADSLRMLLDLFKIRLNDLRGGYSG